MAKVAIKPNRFSGLLDTKPKKNRFSGLLGEQPQPEQPQPERPDLEMIAIPKEKLPGVWNYDKQLDDLLGDPEKPIENFMPMDVRYDFGRILEMTEKPDETGDKMVTSLYYSLTSGIPPRISFNLQDAITKQKFGISLSPKETRNRLADEHYEERRQYYRENFEPFSLFGNAFLQSLAGKPAMAIKGAKVYTPGDALGFDWFLTKTSEYLESLRSKEKLTDVEAAAAGKLWPIDRGASWYQIDPKLLPETINAWSATVGDQIPIMLMTLTGRAIGKVTGKPIGAGVGGLYALITGGPEPTDVATAPVIAKVTEKVVEHLSGAAPLVAMEAGGFMDRANAIGLDNDIAEKYARPYGLGSGAIEYSQWLWNLKAFKMLSPKVKMSVLKKVLIEIGGATWEGIEELSQQGLENFLIGKAIEEQKARTPEYDVEKPETWAGGKRAFGIGLGVSLITRLPGHAYTTMRSRKLAEQIQEQTDATKEEADIAVEAMAEGGRVKQGVVEVITEQRTKQEAKQAEKEVPIEEMPDEQLEEKFRATKFTEPEWKPLYEEIVRRREKPATEGVQADTAKPERPAEKVQASFDKYQKAMPNATEQEVVEALLEDGIRPPADMLKKYEDLPAVQRVLEQDGISRTVKRAAEAKPEAEIETDPKRIQEIKNSIAEGELILRTGKFNNVKYSAEKLEAVRRSVERAKAKIGLQAKPEGKVEKIETDPDKYREDLIKKWGEDKFDKVWFELAEGGENERFSDIDARVSELDEAGRWKDPETKRLRIEMDSIVDAELEKREAPTKAEAEPAKAKTITERQDSELIERWAELDSIEKTKRMPQEIKELRQIEDELIKRHPSEAVEKDITDKARKKVIKDTEEEIQSYDLYQSALQHIGEQQQALPPIQYEIARTKEQIPSEIKDYIGEPGTKGYKGYLWKYLTTYEENPNATGWDEALERVGGRPGDIGEFIERLDQTIQLTRGKAAINQQALDIAIGQGDLYAEIISAKYEMLKKGFGATEINETIREIAQKEDIDLEMAEGYYVPVEETKYVRTKQEILRGLLKESQKAKRKTQRPTLEEAAIRKATEIAHKTKEEHYVYERKGKDAGLFAVSKKPPTEGAYKKIIPPAKGELKGTVEEGYAGFTSEELKEVKKLRQKIHAIAINKGLTKKALSDLKLKHVGYRKLTGKVAGKKISLEQLQNLLKAVQKARPKRVGHKRVITRKTEKKIQSLKENLKKKLQMTDEAFKEILEKEVHGKEPKYTSAKDFITETQGKDIIRRMHDEAEALKATLSFDKAIEKNPEIAGQVKRLQTELDQKGKRDPYRTESMRYYTQQSEHRTGAPIFTMYMDLLNTNLEMHRTRHAQIIALENLVPGFKEIVRDEGALARVSQYIASQSTLKDKPLPPKKITKSEIKLANEIQKIFKDYELKARVNKFFNWYYYNEDIAEFDRFKREIHKAEDIFESQGKEELIEYLKTQTWGVIKSGYEPLESVVMKIKPYKTSPKTVGKGYIKIRTDIEYHSQERNILQRLNSYMKQMDMLYNLSPKINAFVRLYDDHMTDFANPRKVQESVEHFLRNLKRYNVEGGWFGDIMARIYAQASQIIIMAQPVLAFRNVGFQNPAFEHDKTILFDPRNEKLTPDEIEYMEIYVQQLRGMLEEFFMINERSLPGTKTLMKLLKKIKIYAWSDVKNRQWGFWAKINQVKRAQKTKSITEMMERAKFEDMTELEQIRALGILARDGREAMARYVSRVHVDDIHFLYERAQRSPAEMDSLGRVFGNLMLFPRAYTEKLAHAVSKLTSPTSNYTERLRSAKIIASVTIGGIAVGSIYTMITGRKRNPYNPLDILSFRLGGLMLGVTEDVNETYIVTLRALSGDKKALYALTTLIPQMSDMLIPFYDWSLRGLEAGTQTKNLDRAALRKILELIDKEYEVRDGAYKMERNLVESMQYIFAGKSIDYKVVEKKAPKDFGGAKE